MAGGGWPLLLGRTKDGKFKHAGIILHDAVVDSKVVRGGDGEVSGASLRGDAITNHTIWRP